MKTTITFFVLFLSLTYCVNAQQQVNVKTALLIVDIQDFYFPGEGGAGLAGAEEASLAAKEVLLLFRAKNLPVIHVQHKSEKGFEIHKNVDPISGEKRITKEEVNSFNGTDLLEYLKTNDVTRIVIIGMQTHMCLEAATRAAHDLGFDCIVVGDACATRDVKYGETIVKAADVHASTLATLTGGGYARVISLETLVKKPEEYLYHK
jgi:nicotinamidase-related amidase